MCHIAQFPGAEGPEELQAHVGSYPRGVLDGSGPGEVALEGAHVVLDSAHALLEVGGPGALLPGEGGLLLCEGIEPDRELHQFVAQDLGAHGLPPGRVVPERLEEIVLAVDGRHVADYTRFPAQWPALSVVAARLAAVLRLASLVLRETRCFSAQFSQRVWFGMAGRLQSLHLPRALSSLRLLFA